MTKRITSIDPIQLAKILGILHGFMGLLLVPVFLLAFIVPRVLAHGHGAPPPPLAFLLVLGLGGVIAAPLFYAAMGFLTGLIGGFLYNLVATWVGGVKFQVE